MLVLFIAELSAYLSLHVNSNIVIDPNTNSLMRINFNITLYDVPCEYASLDAVDVLGTREENVTRNINKWKVNHYGQRVNFAGINNMQPDILHDDGHDTEALIRNGLHAVLVSGEEFDKWMSRYEYVFVDFYAPWCIWCQRLEPVWESFAEHVEMKHIPLSIIKVDCTEDPEICHRFKVQAFPSLKLFRHGDFQADYRSDRTVDSLVEFAMETLSTNIKLQHLPDEAREMHRAAAIAALDDQPGCQLEGFLMVNRVPGNFHIQARSDYHTINPAQANLSLSVNHLSFGFILSEAKINEISRVPSNYFSVESTYPLNGKSFVSNALHQAFHHYIKVVSTYVDLHSRVVTDNSILAYQMVHTSQAMMYAVDDTPDARFSYDLSPMSVVITRKGKHWYEFMTSICALIGGSFTVLGLVSGALNVLFKPKKI